MKRGHGWEPQIEQATIIGKSQRRIGIATAGLDMFRTKVVADERRRAGERITNHELDMARAANISNMLAAGEKLMRMESNYVQISWSPNMATPTLDGIDCQVWLCWLIDHPTVSS
jgi:hypothetical protein